MRVSYEEELAIHFGLQRRSDFGNGIVLSVRATRLWLSVIRKRSQRGRRGWTWERMQRLARLHLPRPRVPHPYPNERYHARLKVGAV